MADVSLDGYQDPCARTLLYDRRFATSHYHGRVRLAGHAWSFKKVFDALNEIKEVVNVYKPIGRSRKNRVHKLLTRASEIHDELMSALDISTETLCVV